MKRVWLPLIFTPVLVHAAIEAVIVQKVMEDRAIVVRSNGSAYLIEKGVGCLSLWRYQDKRAYVDSPGLFLGVGSSLLIPDADQKCRIWESEPIGSGSAPRPLQTVPSGSGNSGAPTN